VSGGDHRARPHLPGRAPIDAYGAGGFRFGDMSHRGSILCLPSGVYAVDVTRFEEITSGTLQPVVAERDQGAEVLLIGTGRRLIPLPERLRWPLRAGRVSVDTMDTGSAARTYNVMLGENRPVAALLIAVD
jgi:uncharacterized protein